MRILVKILIVLVVLGLAGWASFKPAMEYLALRNRPQWETTQVVRGDAKRIINSTGKLQPVLEVTVGSFVSGQIVEIHADFNDDVKEGDLLAVVDPKLYQAAVDRDQAILVTRRAEVDKASAQLDQAKTRLARGEKLRKKNESFMSEEEMDGLRFECLSLEASIAVSLAAVTQAEANLDNAKTNLLYTEIRSPVSGVILDRKIGAGQTLASQFQTPELFRVAPDLREKMHVLASVDEADIGMIRHAYEQKLPVTFTVDAYPNEVFQGYIEQVRYSATELQNVITYPVIVAAANADLKLLPKMTANVSFEVDSRAKVLKIPNAALRYYPENIDYVHPDDRKLLDGSQWASSSGRNREDTPPQQDTVLSAAEQAESARNANLRHVWVVKDGLLRAVPVTISFAESRFTVVESGDVEEGMELVTGIKKKQNS